MRFFGALRSRVSHYSPQTGFRSLPSTLPINLRQVSANQPGWVSVGLRGISSFREIPGIPDRVVDHLSASGITRPTPIQGQSLKTIRSKRTCYVCAPTGTGKTISFLAPIFSMLSSHLRTPPKSRRRPLVLILAPSDTLCMQLHADVQLTWGTSPDAVWDDTILEPPYHRGGRLSYCLLTDADDPRPFPQEMDCDNAPVFLVTTPQSLLQQLEAWSEAWSDDINATQGLENGDVQPVSSSAPEASDRRTKRSQSSTKSSGNDILWGMASRLSRCKPIVELFSSIEHVVVDEVDECLDPPSKYANLKQKQSQTRKPPPAAVLLTMLKQIRSASGYQLICTSATLNSRVRHMVAQRKWGRGPFGNTQIVQRTGPLTLPIGLSHYYHVYSDFLPLYPNPFFSLPSASTGLPLSREEVSLSQRIQAKLDAFAEVWRTHLPDIRSCLLVVPTLEVSSTGKALEKLADTIRLVSDGAPPSNEFCLPRARVVSLDSKVKLYQVQRERVSRKLQNVHHHSTPDHNDTSLEELEKPIISEAFSDSQKRTLPIDLYVCDWKQVRGLDLTNISHVFLLDVPPTPQLYIHMAGRTGRGRFAAGRVFTLVHRSDKKKLLRVYDQVQQYQPLPEEKLTGIELEELRIKSGLKRGHDSVASSSASIPRMGTQDQDGILQQIDPQKLSKRQKQQKKVQALHSKRQERLRLQEGKLLSRLRPESLPARQVIREAARRRMVSGSQHWLAEAAIPGDRERLDHDTIPREKIDAALRAQAEIEQAQSE